MNSRLAAVVALASLPMSAVGGPYRVVFHGEIGEVHETAPSTFYVGERVRGAFIYDPDAPIALKVVWRFTTVDGTGSPGSPGYTGFPTDDDNTLISQVFRGGAAVIETESGFRAHDEAIDFLWLGSGAIGQVRFVGATDTGPLVGNSGSLANVLLGEGAVASTFTVTHGPPAFGFRLTVGYAAPDIIEDEHGDPEATLRSLADPDAFPGITSGQLFFEPTPNSFADPQAGVSFVVDRVEVIAIPEPVTLVAVVWGWIVGWTTLSPRPAGSPPARA